MDPKMSENKSEVSLLKKESLTAESDMEKGEKLYVTADKRGEKGGCKRPLCWTLLGLVVIAIVALIVLAATGILFTSTPKTLEQYNASLSSARAFGGLIHDNDSHDHDHHDHDHHDHMHDHDHSHNNDHDNDIHDIIHNNEGASTELPHQKNAETDGHLNPSDGGDIYVPKTLEGELRIDNKEFVPAFEDPDSDDYREFAENFKESLKNSLFDKDTLENGDNDISIEIVEIRNGSIIVTYRIKWNPKRDEGNTEDFLTAESLKTKLDNYLNQNNRMISVYHIADENIVTKAVLDLCKINKNDCEYKCEFDESTLDFSCICPRGQIEDIRLSKNCIPLLNENEKIPPGHESGELAPETTSESVSISNESGRSGYSQGEYEEIPTPGSDPMAEPEPEPEPTTIPNLEIISEPKSEPEPIPISEPKPESEPIPTSEPNPEPEPIPASEPKPEPEPIPTSEPIPEPEPVTTSTTTPAPEPILTSGLFEFEPRPAPELNVETGALPASEPSPEPAYTTTVKSISELEQIFIPGLAEQKPVTTTSSEPTPELSPEEKSIENSNIELQTNQTNEHMFNEESLSEPRREGTESSQVSSDDKFEQVIAFKPTYDNMPQFIDSTIEPEIEFKSIPEIDLETTTEVKESTVTITPVTIKSDRTDQKSINEIDENSESKVKSNPEKIFNVDRIINEQFSTSEPIFNKTDALNNNNLNQISDSNAFFHIKEVLPENVTQTDNSRASTEQPSMLESQMSIESSTSTEANSVSKENIITGNVHEFSTNQTPNDDDWLQSDEKETDLSALINKVKFMNSDHDSRINENSQDKEQRVSKSFNDFEIDTTTQTTHYVNNSTEVGEITLDFVSKLYGTMNHDIETESNVEKTITGVLISSSDKDFEDYKKQIMSTEESVQDVTETNSFTNYDEELKPTSTESSKFKFISTYQPDSESAMNKHILNVTNNESPIFNVTKHETNTENIGVSISYNPEDKTSGDVQEKTIFSKINSSTEKDLSLTNKIIDDSKKTSSSLEFMKEVTVIPDVDPDWLSESVTEVSYESMGDKKDNTYTTQTSINQDEMMSSGIKHDFEPDYINTFETKSRKSLNQEDPAFGMINDYESEDSRIKKENNVHVQDMHVSSNQEQLDLKQDDQYETTTIIDYIYTSINQSKEDTFVEPGVIYATPVPKEEYHSDELHKKVDAITSTSNNFSQDNINELSSHNSTHSIGKKIVHHSTEYDDHDTEMNPFLPDVENNKVLVKKLQEGNDIVEPTNLNETQNDNVDEHNPSILHGEMNKLRSLDSNLTNDMKSILQENQNTSELFNELPHSQENTRENTTINDRNPESSIEQTTESREYNVDSDENREASQTPTFLLDTDDLDRRAPKRRNFNSLNYNDNDSLRVVPIEDDESPYSKENIRSINDISDSRKKSERRTIGLDSSEFVSNNEA